MDILLATDGSASAVNAERLVTSDAFPSGTHVVALFVDEIGGAPAFAAERYRAVRAAARRAATAHLAQLRDALAAGGREVQTVIARGRPASVIVREARRRACDVVVIGSRGRGALASTLLGSVAASVAENAPCPVLIARTSAITRIALADDGSDGARLAEEIVAAADWLRRLPVVAVTAFGAVPWYVAADGASGLGLDPVLYQRVVEEERADTLRTASQAAERLRARGVAVTAAVREGYPPAAIIAAAGDAQADLIVIGSRGERGLRRLLLGSAARSVLVNAPCSVLVTRAKVPARPSAS